VWRATIEVDPAVVSRIEYKVGSMNKENERVHVCMCAFWKAGAPQVMCFSESVCVCVCVCVLHVWFVCVCWNGVCVCVCVHCVCVRLCARISMVVHVDLSQTLMQQCRRAISHASQCRPLTLTIRHSAPPPSPRDSLPAGCAQDRRWLNHLGERRQQDR
jgi:hypothetical protein